MTLKDVEGLDPEARDYFYDSYGFYKQISLVPKFALNQALYELEMYLENRKEDEKIT